MNIIVILAMIAILALLFLLIWILDNVKSKSKRIIITVFVFLLILSPGIISFFNDLNTNRDNIEDNTVSPPHVSSENIKDPQYEERDEIDIDESNDEEELSSASSSYSSSNNTETNDKKSQDNTSTYTPVPETNSYNPYSSSPSTYETPRQPIRQLCRTCRGNGSCYVCSGTGQVPSLPVNNGYNTMVRCRNCGGSGICNSCKGDGYIDEGVDF